MFGKTWMFLMGMPLLFSLQVGQPISKLNEDRSKVAEANFYATTFFPSNHITIESILYNPAVDKKKVARNLIQATGYGEEKNTQFVIYIRKEQLHGTYESFYRDNQLCDSGKLNRNLPDGEWKTWYPNGQLKTIRTYSAEKYRYIKAELPRINPKFPKYAISQQAAANHKVDHYFKPVYEPAETNPSISLLEKIKNNTSGEHGYLPPFKDCLHHGMYVNYHPDGRVKDSGHYANGLKQGLWQEMVADGDLYAVGGYHHGFRHGQWKYYSKENNLLYTEYYKANGQLDSWHHFKNRSLN